MGKGGNLRSPNPPPPNTHTCHRNMVGARPFGGAEDEMQLTAVLGEGSYGKVYKGLWRGTVVAVKVMILPAAMSGKERREKMAVMETAISSSLSHPNIVQTFTYSISGVTTERRRSAPLPLAPGLGPGSGGAFGGGAGSLHDSSGSLESREAGGGGLGSGSSVQSWELRLVQELCDLGSLRDALNAGTFKPTAPAAPAGGEGAAAAGAEGAAAGGGSGGGGQSGGQSGGQTGEGGGQTGVGGGQTLDRENLLKVLDTALDIARAVAHLHAQSIIHSDLKARNILLKSAPAESRGFVAKVADFGLSMEINPQDTHISNAFQGTITHMAPELLLSGHVSRASDAYAFGILLWELATGGHAYAGLPRALLGHCITKQGLRPHFPPGSPFELRFLACRCWETDPLIRPSFVEIMRELTRIRGRYLQDPPAPGAASTATTAPCAAAAASLPAAARASAPAPPTPGSR
ncbi:MAG: kinase-like domain-containing protein [Monoraphidium minutum]|nr:MAG: kinase-like domain-containing protein [Monoraphidium minutum]